MTDQKGCCAWSIERSDHICLQPVADGENICAKHKDMMKIPIDDGTRRVPPSMCGSSGPEPEMSSHAYSKSLYERAIAEAPYATSQFPPVVDEDTPYFAEGAFKCGDCGKELTADTLWSRDDGMTSICKSCFDVFGGEPTDDDELEPCFDDVDTYNADFYEPTDEDYKAAQENDAVGKQLGELDWQAERALAKGTVTRSDILAWHRQLCEEARDLMTLKNKDYASDADPLRNFSLSAQAAGISRAQCALVYLAENAAKYRSFIENGGKTASRTEKLVDHIRDSINFNVLLYAILIDEGYFEHEGAQDAPR